MAAMRASGQRLCQMVHDVGLRHGAEDRLQTVLATGWWMAAVDAKYDSQLDQIIVISIYRSVGERSNFKKNPTHTQDHGDA